MVLASEYGALSGYVWVGVYVGLSFGRAVNKQLCHTLQGHKSQTCAGTVIALLKKTLG